MCTLLAGQLCSRRGKPGGKPCRKIAHGHLILPVESSREDIDRASVTVERRVGEKLVVQRQVTALSDGKIIIRFQRLLAGIAQVAVAVKNARAARLQEGLLLRTKHRPNCRRRPKVSPGRRQAAPLTLRPSWTVQSASLNVAAAVWPSCQPSPPEHADVLRNLLFPIHPKAVFVMEAEGGRWDGYFRSWRSIRRRRGGEQKSESPRCSWQGNHSRAMPEAGWLRDDPQCANGAPIPASFPTVSKTPRRRCSPQTRRAT